MGRYGMGYGINKLKEVPADKPTPKVDTKKPSSPEAQDAQARKKAAEYIRYAKKQYGDKWNEGIGDPTALDKIKGKIKYWTDQIDKREPEVAELKKILVSDPSRENIEAFTAAQQELLYAKNQLAQRQKELKKFEQAQAAYDKKGEFIGAHEAKLEKLVRELEYNRNKLLHDKIDPLKRERADIAADLALKGKGPDEIEAALEAFYAEKIEPLDVKYNQYNARLDAARAELAEYQDAAEEEKLAIALQLNATETKGPAAAEAPAKGAAETGIPAAGEIEPTDAEPAVAGVVPGVETAPPATTETKAPAAAEAPAAAKPRRKPKALSDKWENNHDMAAVEGALAVTERLLNTTGSHGIGGKRLTLDNIKNAVGFAPLTDDEFKILKEKKHAKGTKAELDKRRLVANIVAFQNKVGTKADSMFGLDTWEASERWAKANKDDPEAKRIAGILKISIPGETTVAAVSQEEKVAPAAKPIENKPALATELEAAPGRTIKWVGVTRGQLPLSPYVFKPGANQAAPGYQLAEGWEMLPAGKKIAVLNEKQPAPGYQSVLVEDFHKPGSLIELYTDTTMLFELVKRNTNTSDAIVAWNSELAQKKNVKKGSAVTQAIDTEMPPSA